MNPDYDPFAGLIPAEWKSSPEPPVNLKMPFFLPATVCALAIGKCSERYALFYLDSIRAAFETRGVIPWSEMKKFIDLYKSPVTFQGIKEGLVRVSDETIAMASGKRDLSSKGILSAWLCLKLGIRHAEMELERLPLAIATNTDRRELSKPVPRFARAGIIRNIASLKTTESSIVELMRGDMTLSVP